MECRIPSVVSGEKIHHHFAGFPPPLPGIQQGQILLRLGYAIFPPSTRLWVQASRHLPQVTQPFFIASLPASIYPSELAKGGGASGFGWLQTNSGVHTPLASILPGHLPYCFCSVLTYNKVDTRIVGLDRYMDWLMYLYTNVYT